MLIVGGLLVAIVVIVVLVLSLGGGKGKSTASTAGSTASGSTTQTSAQGETSTKRSTTSAPATTSPAQLSVAVLNGTTTTGLAHHVSEELAQRGYSKAMALTGQPPGANQVTTVQYTSGHSADAQSVAHALGVSQAQPIEGTVASLAPSATVVVIVGLDKA